MSINVLSDLTYTWNGKKPNPQKQSDGCYQGAAGSEEILVQEYKLPVRQINFRDLRHSIVIIVNILSYT